MIIAKHVLRKQVIRVRQPKLAHLPQIQEFLLNSPKIAGKNTKFYRSQNFFERFQIQPRVDYVTERTNEHVSNSYINRAYTVTQSPQTSVSLILRVADENDVSAWEEFTQIYQPLVYRIAVSRGLQSADANDLVQEVMTRVARSVSRWDPDPGRGSFRGWISRIARNLIIDFLKNKNRLPRTSDHSDIRRLVEDQPNSSDASNLFDLEFEKQVFIAAAQKIKMKFTENTWQAFWQTAVQNQPVEKVAENLQMTSGAIYVARSRVMARLKESVKSILALSE